MGSFSEDSSEMNKFVIGIWAGVYLTTPFLLPPALNACYAGYNISNIYNLSQIISQPTRITSSSKSLIDLCFTNYPDKVTVSGTHSLGISDHSLIYLIRKSNHQVIHTNYPVTRRQMKNFNDEEFLNDIRQINWSDINSQNNPNDMWAAWLTKSWFRSYLTDRRQNCFVNGQLSGTSSTSRGVPQGSIIGPLLFLVYINDLPNCLNEGFTRMFADDTNLHFSSDNLSHLEFLMNSSLINLNRWLIANKLSLNIAKTEFMIIGSRQRVATFNNYELSVSVDNVPVRQVSSTKTLGLTLDENLTWRN
jgi:hypothetical protein